MNQEESRCPRCSDYDKVKEELENNKRTSDKEVKDSLKNCESQKKKLQKQLLTAGAIAIIAGTILGKDFVDKVADYINSFNDVKNKATDLIGATIPIPIEQPTEVATIEKEEEIQKPYLPPTAGYFTRTIDDDVFRTTSTTSLVDMALGMTDSLKDFNIFLQNQTEEPIDLPLILDDFLYFNTSIEVGYQPSVFDIPYRFTEQSPLTIVPAPGSLVLIGVAFASMTPRRR